MLILLVQIHVKPEHLEEFKQATIVNATNSSRNRSGPPFQNGMPANRSSSFPRVKNW